YSTDDYIGLTQYAPNGDQRWTTRFGSTTGNDKLYRVARDANGALLVTAGTTGLILLGTLSINGTPEAPAYYLAKLQPAQLQPDSRTILCLGSSVTLPGRYAGYFDQELTVQLSNAAGSFETPITIGRVPVNTPGNYFSGPVTPPALTLPASLSTGAGYQIRLVSAVPMYISEPMAVTINMAPMPPLITQVGDDFVSSAPTGNQWFTAAKQPVPGATRTNFKPGQMGQYYVVATVNGCPSPPSELLTYLITALEPTRPAADLVIYPNPATDRVRVEWTGVTAGVLAEVLLYDISGKLCRRVGRVDAATDLWLNDLSAGLYIIRVQVAGQQINSRRLVIR
ncbi:MAG: T9SS type A sorting domain-containing protein, partial [Bacteroidetes bacterium]|nr:T9SS type A sorting domain-containing protein [Fibrella sp.]